MSNILKLRFRGPAPGTRGDDMSTGCAQIAAQRNMHVEVVEARGYLGDGRRVRAVAMWGGARWPRPGCDDEYDG